MKTFLDVGVVRVQRYLTAPRHLRSQRGGSAMIKFATSRVPECYGDAILGEDSGTDLGPSQDGQFDPIGLYCSRLARAGFLGWMRNPAAGDIDGVVSLVVETEVSSSDITRIAGLVIGWLRIELPHAEFTAHYRSTEQSYVEAYPQMETISTGGLVFGNDYPALLTCDECGRTPVTGRYELSNSKTEETRIRRVCADCQLREDRLGRIREPDPDNPNTVAPSFAVEGIVRAAVAKEKKRPKIGVAEHFANLADLQEGYRTNHLATVFIDGDAMGDRFQELDTDPKRLAAVGGLSDATEHALNEATLAIFQDGYRIVPAIAHVRGGDDVVVTVIASAAWRFAREFLEVFEAEAGRFLRGATASAAIVFAKHTTPFALQFDRAEEVLTATKRAAAKHRYRRRWVERNPNWAKDTSSIGWADFTRDYVVPTGGFHPTLAELNGLDDELNNLGAKLTPTRRESWLRLLGEPDKDAVRDQLLSDARRHDLKDLVEPYLGTDPASGGSPTWTLDTLLERLAMLRWWK
ncbi:MAG: hypothetical protein LBJ08_11585 [Bifidobacteriaceae bacterium]|jgi:hypothetical protein|nr:hypothetical protein [Bifidobacteriaceae bacterium]